ncbi:uncharacterized protein A4U43_C08F27910 [Asparagus officinalis]|nr:uncharacterized protein A4U43_C08F27910 [Asparagus officinalis]
MAETEEVRIEEEREGVVGFGVGLGVGPDEENSLQKVTKREVREGQPIIDILEINKLRRQLLFQSYFWDQCLIYTAQQSGNGTEGFSSWIELPFSNFYCSINKDENSPKVDALNEYSPVYISLFQDLECQGRARLFFPVGTNDTVIPVYDDEPTSIICYALVSYDYSSQMSDEQEKVRDTHCSSLSFTKDLHARVYFSGDGPLGQKHPHVWRKYWEYTRPSVVFSSVALSLIIP